MINNKIILIRTSIRTSDVSKDLGFKVRAKAKDLGSKGQGQGLVNRSVRTDKEQGQGHITDKNLS